MLPIKVVELTRSVTQLVVVIANASVLMDLLKIQTVIVLFLLLFQHQYLLQSLLVFVTESFVNIKEFVLLIRTQKLSVVVKKPLKRKNMALNSAIVQQINQLIGQTVV
jgi:hypothetical protein